AIRLVARQDLQNLDDLTAEAEADAVVPHAQAILRRLDVLELHDVAVAGLDESIQRSAHAGERLPVQLAGFLQRTRCPAEPPAQASPRRRSASSCGMSSPRSASALASAAATRSSSVSGSSSSGAFSSARSTGSASPLV